MKNESELKNIYSVFKITKLVCVLNIKDSNRKHQTRFLLLFNLMENFQQNILKYFYVLNKIQKKKRSMVCASNINYLKSLQILVLLLNIRDLIYKI